MRLLCCVLLLSLHYHLYCSLNFVLTKYRPYRVAIKVLPTSSAPSPPRPQSIKTRSFLVAAWRSPSTLTGCRKPNPDLPRLLQVNLFSTNTLTLNILIILIIFDDFHILLVTIASWMPRATPSFDRQRPLNHLIRSRSSISTKGCSLGRLGPVYLQHVQQLLYWAQSARESRQGEGVGKRWAQHTVALDSRLGGAWLPLHPQLPSAASPTPSPPQPLVFIVIDLPLRSTHSRSLATIKRLDELPHLRLHLATRCPWLHPPLGFALDSSRLLRLYPSRSSSSPQPATAALLNRLPCNYLIAPPPRLYAASSTLSAFTRSQMRCLPSSTPQRTRPQALQRPSQRCHTRSWLTQDGKGASQSHSTASSIRGRWRLTPD